MQILAGVSQASSENPDLTLNTSMLNNTALNSSMLNASNLGERPDRAFPLERLLKT